MARRKARKGGSRARTAARKRPAAKKKPARRGAAAGGAAATRRVAQLEAENRRLRDELASLRAQQAESAVAGDTAAETTPTLPL